MFNLWTKRNMNPCSVTSMATIIKAFIIKEEEQITWHVIQEHLWTWIWRKISDKQWRMEAKIHCNVSLPASLSELCRLFLCNEMFSAPQNACDYFATDNASSWHSIQELLAACKQSSHHQLPKYKWTISAIHQNPSPIFNINSFWACTDKKIIQDIYQHSVSYPKKYK